LDRGCDFGAGRATKERNAPMTPIGNR